MMIKQGTLAVVMAVTLVGSVAPVRAQRLPPMYAPRYYDNVRGAYEPDIVARPPIIVAPAYGPPGYDAALPSQEVFAILRSTGFSPLGVPARRGRFYVVAAIHPNGEDGRVTIDAISGQLVRFVPAYAVARGGRYDDLAVEYGQPMDRSPPAVAIRPVPRPLAPVPKLASRSPSSAPMVTPKPRPPAARNPVTAQAPPAKSPAEAPPAAAKPEPAAPPEAKPVENKPAAVAPLATQPMPPVQPLD